MIVASPLIVVLAVSRVIYFSSRYKNLERTDLFPVMKWDKNIQRLENVLKMERIVLNRSIALEISIN